MPDASTAIEEHRGTIATMTADGVHAAFVDPIDPIRSALQLQQALSAAQAIGGP